MILHVDPPDLSWLWGLLIAFGLLAWISGPITKRLHEFGKPGWIAVIPHAVLAVGLTAAFLLGGGDALALYLVGILTGNSELMEQGSQYIGLGGLESGICFIGTVVAWAALEAALLAAAFLLPGKKSATRFDEVVQTSDAARVPFASGSGVVSVPAPVRKSRKLLWSAAVVLLAAGAVGGFMVMQSRDAIAARANACRSALGAAHDTLGLVSDSGSAVAACKAAIADNPGDPDINFDLALALGPLYASKSDALFLRASAKEAAPFLHASADAGYARGELLLGETLIRAGHRDEGLALYRKAAEQGFATAECWLGVEEQNSHNLKASRYWYTRAANHGDFNAQVIAGYSSLRGDAGWPQDPVLAAKWFLAAVTTANEHPSEKTRYYAGFADAEQQLGVLYLNGEGVQKDSNKAFYWFMKGARDGNRDSEDSLGYAYLSGEGTAQDKAQAFKWFLASANHGNANAQYMTGRAYYLGEGTARDDLLALSWLGMSVVKTFGTEACVI
ncbi:MAG: tetratricopeptide repeat protein [Terriglobia bacterium]|nr:tetratricopeptide repeat protein [Terriglobia bacterium]